MFEGWKLGSKFKTSSNYLVTILNIQVYEDTAKRGEKVRFLLCEDVFSNQLTYDMEGNPISSLARTYGPLITNVSLGLANQQTYGTTVDPMETVHSVLPGFAKEETDMEILDMDKASLEDNEFNTSKIEDNEAMEEDGVAVEDLPEEPDDDEQDDLPIIDNDEPL